MSAERAEVRRSRVPTKAMVNEQLRYSWTPKGVKLWWDCQRWQLDGRTPAQAWNDGDKQRVYDLAVAGRDMVAT